VIRGSEAASLTLLVLQFGWCPRSEPNWRMCMTLSDGRGASRARKGSMRTMSDFTSYAIFEGTIHTSYFGS
jgi:hypothetical protein